jgi:hypothetical protein
MVSFGHAVRGLLSELRLSSGPPVANNFPAGRP